MEESGSCADGWAMLNKSLIQFSVEKGRAPSLLFALRTNYGRANKGNVDFLYLKLFISYISYF